MGHIKLQNPSRCADVKYGVLDSSIPEVSARGEGMSETDSKDAAYKVLARKYFGDTTILYIKVSSLKSEAISSGQYAGGFYTIVSGQIYRYSEERKRQLDGTSSSSATVMNESEARTAVNSVLSVTSSISSQASSIVSSVLDKTGTKNASELAQKALETLKADKLLSQALSSSTTAKITETVQKLIDKNLDSELTKKLQEITSKYGGSLTSQTSINEALSAIRSYKYALINDPAFKAEQESSSIEAINKMLADGTDKITASGSEYVASLINKFDSTSPELYAQIDKQLELVSTKTAEAITKISEVDVAKINNILSNQLYDVVSKSEKIESVISKYSNQLSKLGIKLPANQKITADLKAITDKISLQTSTNILPLVQENQKKATNVTEIITEVKNAVNLAKQEAQKYINKLKDLANDYIARETAILTQEISKYVKLNIGDVSGYVSKLF